MIRLIDSNEFNSQFNGNLISAAFTLVAIRIKACVQPVITAVLVGIIQTLNIRYLRASESHAEHDGAVRVYLNLITEQSIILTETQKKEEQAEDRAKERHRYIDTVTQQWEEHIETIYRKRGI